VIKRKKDYSEYFRKQISCNLSLFPANFFLCQKWKNFNSEKKLLSLEIGYIVCEALVSKCFQKSLKAKTIVWPSPEYLSFVVELFWGIFFAMAYLL
jgi:hypothetical protein